MYLRDDPSVVDVVRGLRDGLSELDMVEGINFEINQVHYSEYPGTVCFDMEGMVQSDIILVFGSDSFNVCRQHNLFVSIHDPQASGFIDNYGIKAVGVLASLMYLMLLSCVKS